MITLAAVGRLKAGPERELFDRYWARTSPLAKKLGFGALALHELRESQASSAEARKVAEAEALLGKLPVGSSLIVFDERGNSPSSQQFALTLADHRDAGRTLSFVIGGPDGLDPSIRAKARHVVSFGGLTMPHQLVRVLVAEQIYRAMTVLDGHPYHRD